MMMVLWIIIAVFSGGLWCCLLNLVHPRRLVFRNFLGVALGVNDGAD